MFWFSCHNTYQKSMNDPIKTFGSETHPLLSICLDHFTAFTSLTTTFKWNSFGASPRSIFYYITWPPVKSLSCPFRLRPWLSTYQCHNYSCKAESKKLRPESSNVTCPFIHVRWSGIFFGSFTNGGVGGAVFLYFYWVCELVSSAMLFIDQAAIYWVTYTTWVCPKTTNPPISQYPNLPIPKRLIRGELLA